MPPTVLQVLKMQVKAYKVQLEKLPAKEKKSFVSATFAERFNALLEELKTAEPALGPNLPKPIPFYEDYGALTVVPTEFIQVEIAVAQIIDLIQLHEDHA